MSEGKKQNIKGEQMKLNNNSSPWLNSKNCKDSDFIEFLNEGEWRESTQFKYKDGNPVKQLVFQVRHEGKEKQLSLIKSSRDSMIKAFGDDTIEWVGQKARISLALNTQGGKSILLTPMMPVEGVKPSEPSSEIDLDASSDESVPF